MSSIFPMERHTSKSFPHILHVDFNLNFSTWSLDLKNYTYAVINYPSGYGPSNISVSIAFEGPYLQWHFGDGTSNDGHTPCDDWPFTILYSDKLVKFFPPNPSSPYEKRYLRFIGTFNVTVTFVKTIDKDQDELSLQSWSSTFKLKSNSTQLILTDSSWYGNWIVSSSHETFLANPRGSLIDHVSYMSPDEVISTWNIWIL